MAFHNLSQGIDPSVLGIFELPIARHIFIVDLGRRVHAVVQTCPGEPTLRRAYFSR